MEIKLRPFLTPNHVIEDTPPVTRQQGWKQPVIKSLNEVPAEELSLMCDAFRKEIFEKVGVEDPRI